MVVPTIDKLVKEKFNKIYNESIYKANKEFESNFIPKCKNLSIFEQFKLVKLELGKLYQIENHFEVPSYIKNANSKEWLLKLFSGRTAVLNVDDSKLLEEGIIYGQLKSEIAKLKIKLYEKIPKYTYVQFLKGEEDPFFFELECTHGVSKEEYYKIRIWQSTELINLVTFETKLIIQDIQVKSMKDNRIIEKLIADKEYYEKYIENRKFANISILINHLKNLYILSGCNFYQLNNNETIENFKYYQNEQIHYKKITPQSIKLIYDNYSKNKHKTTFTPSQFIFYTIDKVFQWVEELIKGKSINEEYIEIDYKGIFNNVMNNARKKANEIINNFYLSNNIDNISIKQKKRLYFDILEDIRYKYNNIEFKYYFAGLADETILMKSFITNTFFSNDIEYNSNALTEAYLIHEQAYTFISDLYDITNSRELKYPMNHSSSATELIYLSNTMVLSRELYLRMDQILDNFMMEFELYYFPFELLRINFCENMENLFHDCINCLLNYLEDCESPNKILYIHSRLKELKKRELDFKHYNNKDFKRSELKFTSMFKEYLEIEAEYIRDTKDVNVLSELPDFIPLSLSMCSENKSTLINKRKFRSNLKKFPEYLLHNKRIQLAESIKKEFSTEKGKGIRLLIKALEERKIINIQNRQFKAIYKSIKDFYERDIGTYQSVRDFHYIEEKHEPDYDSILQKLDYILNQLINS